MFKDKLRAIMYSNPITGTLCKLRSRFIFWRNNVWCIKKTRLLHPNTIFLVLTPDHGNIGDHAITIAELKMLKEMKVRYFEITYNHILRLIHLNKLGIFNGSTIAVNGGGNLGTLWFDVENSFRKLIIENPKSKIVALPNTFFYEDSEYGKQELENSIRIYNSHPSLHLFAREEISYSAMKNIYNNVYLVPDMVLTLSYPANGTQKNGCLLCFRNDLEKTMSSSDEAFIQNIAEKHFNHTTNTDMVENKFITPAEREKAVMQKIEQFQKSELVITDRLHAMVFSAITETPCIVVNSKSPKVKGIYEYLKHLPYIRFADNLNDIDSLISEVLSCPNRKYDNSAILAKYDKITEILKRTD